MMKFFKRKKKFKKENLESTLNLFWELALGLMSMLFVAAVFFGYYLFMKTNKEPDLPVVQTSAGVETVKNERIDKVLLYFSDREEKSTEILNSPAPVIDPSI